MAHNSWYIGNLVNVPSVGRSAAGGWLLRCYALVYTTARSEFSGYSLQVPATESDLADQDRFLYIHPEEHEWNRSEKSGLPMLSLPKGDFATLRRVDLNRGKTLQVGEDGLHTFVTPTASGGDAEGHQGIWNSPGGFEKITYTWVFPEVFEPVTYESNQPGEWVRRYNTVTYYGKDVNDLVFTMTYRSRLNELYGKLKKMFGDEDKIDVTEGADGIRLSIEATLLYPSGVAELSPNGRGVLSRVSGALQDDQSVRIIVEGHTDTDRIGGTLAERFPTNWELSSARSINVIRYLISRASRSRGSKGVLSVTRARWQITNPRKVKPRTEELRFCWQKADPLVTGDRDLGVFAARP